ncbi:MAG: hypothetical protein J3K34DRAFT_33954 [Monoraphidium minutum]|nr:MAG: hypothetical protein J3K34DRAFT_33954 [Monoraphidium minutum]
MPRPRRRRCPRRSLPTRNSRAKAPRATHTGSMAAWRLCGRGAPTRGGAGGQRAMCTGTPRGMRRARSRGRASGAPAAGGRRRARSRGRASGGDDGGRAAAAAACSAARPLASCVHIPLPLTSHELGRPSPACQKGAQTGYLLPGPHPCKWPAPVLPSMRAPLPSARPLHPLPSSTPPSRTQRRPLQRPARGLPARKPMCFLQALYNRPSWLHSAGVEGMLTTARPSVGAARRPRHSPVMHVHGVTKGWRASQDRRPLV